MNEDRYNQILQYRCELEEALNEDPDYQESGSYVLDLVNELLDEIDRLQGEQEHE